MDLFDNLSIEPEVKSSTIEISHKIERITLDDVTSLGSSRFNSLNHYEVGKRPEDYFDQIEKTRTYNWIDKFRCSYIVININQSELAWINQAADVGKITGNFPEWFNDELDNLLSNLEKTPLLKNLFENGEKYFVRSDDVSLKTGKYGLGPYFSMKNILISSITCTSEHSPIRESNKSLKFYLLPWLEINSGKEFRIFICNNKITAISQQNLYNVNQYLKHLSDEEANATITNWIKIIHNFFIKTIKKLIDHIDSYSIDLCLLENDEPYLIEINGFGKEYSAGSSLFHWNVDEEILYDLKDENIIYFRYVHK